MSTDRRLVVGGMAALAALLVMVLVFATRDTSTRPLTNLDLSIPRFSGHLS